MNPSAGGIPPVTNGGGNINPSDILSTPQGPPTDSSWRTPEKRQLVIKKIAETVKLYPDVLTRNPADVETSIFQRARSEHEYMNMVGKIVLSIKQKGMMQHQQQQWQHGMGGGEWQRPVMQPGFPPFPSYPGALPPHRMIYNNVPPHMSGAPIHHPTAPAGLHPPPHGPPMMNTGRPSYIVRPPPPGPPHRAAGIQIHPGGECVVSAVPNPSFPPMDQRPPGAPSPYPAPPTAPPTTQPQANSPKPPQSVPSPRAHPLPSPNTPWNPNSPSATATSSPSQAPSTSTNSTVTPEANAAVLLKLQELQPYIPLLARMIDKLARGDKDKARSDQLTKLTSLYNVLHSKNMKVSLQTLEKCHVALKRIFEKDQPTAAPPPAPVINEPTPPRPPVPPTPPISSMSLHDFKIIHSPPPLSSYLQPLMDDCNDPLLRLSPNKRMKLDEQASKSFICGIKRELNDLTQFNIKQIPNPTVHTVVDGSITIQCTIVDDSLPSIPPLLITIPCDYPSTSPHCSLPDNEREGEGFHISVYELLKDKLSNHSGHYTISCILKTWESCLIQKIAKQLREDIVHGL